MATARLLSAKICRLIGRYDQKTNGRRFIRAVSKRRGERASLDPPRRSPRAPARWCPRRRSRSEAHQRPDSHRTSARDDRRDGAPRRRAAHAVPAKVATCLGTSHASGSPTRPEDDRRPRPRPTRPRRSPRAGEPGRRAGCLRRARERGAPVSPRRGEERLAIVPRGRVRRVGRETPSVVQKDALGKDKDAKACGHKPCSRPFTVLLRRHHCRACGLVFCARCVETRLLLDPQTAEPVTSRVAAAAETAPGVSPRAYAYAATNAPSRRPRRRRSAKARVKARAWRRWRRKRRKRLLLPTSRNTGTRRFRYRKRLVRKRGDARARRRFSRRLFPEKASDAERKETRVSSKAESSEASDASKESLGGAVTSSGRSVTLRRNSADGVPQREDAHRGARRGTNRDAGARGTNAVRRMTRTTTTTTTRRAASRRTSTPLARRSRRPWRQPRGAACVARRRRCWRRSPRF